MSRIGRLAHRVLPVAVDEWLRRQRPREGPPPLGDVRFGDFRRLVPMSRAFGFDRGQPVDRHYIEAFLASHAADVRGRVMEVGDDGYTRRFGGDRVTQRDVLHVDASNANATIVADLARGDGIPTNAFDCIVLTQTLHLIYDVPAAVRTLHRILRPGGVCLITVPGISQIDVGAWRDSWCWAFTPYSLRRALADRFPDDTTVVRSYGNVLAASAFLYGLAAEELSPSELDAADPAYPVTVAARATKSGD